MDRCYYLLMERKRSKSRWSKSLHLPDSILPPPTEPSPNSDLTGTLSGGKNLLVHPNPVQRSLRNNDVSNGGAMAGQNSLRVGQTQKQSFVKPDKQMVQRRTSGWLGSTHMDRRFAQQLLSLLEPRKPPEMTIKSAVELLDQTNGNKLIYAAACIQNQCFKNDEARVEVHRADGAKKLVQLLKSDNKQVQRVAAGALRNVVYKNEGNKKHVKDENGLTVILNLLNKTYDKDTIRQLAGLLWNLSSDDEIKMLFDENVLKVLTKVILVPFSNRNKEAESSSYLTVRPNAFLCAIRCLRNLSSDCNHRKNMRQCGNLIDSLVSFTTETATKPTPDDESTQICVCILHNLTYEAEKDWIPQTTKDKGETQRTATPKETTCSCFPYRPANLRKDPEDEEKAEESRPLLNSDGPRGAQGLWSGQLVQAYLSLLTCSKNKITLTAAMGALQNLTVGKGKISENVAKIIQEQNGLQKIKTLLEKDVTLKKPALLLMRNLSCFPELHNSILDNLLWKNDTETLLRHLDISAEESSELMPVLCLILINLSKNNAATASLLSHEQDVIDMLKKKHEGTAKRAVKKLKNTLQKSSQTSEED